VAAIVIFARYQLDKPKVAAVQAHDRLNQAVDLIQDLENGARSPAEARQAESFIREALGLTQSRGIQGEGQLALGEYYWALANYPIPPEAATQPSLRPELSQEELLNKAEEYYGKAGKEQTAQPYLAARARLGLAAVAETRAYVQDRASGYKVSGDKNPQ